MIASIAVLQIKDFQLVSQWAEGLKGILRPQLVQESCIFLLPRSTKNGESQCWFILYHVDKVLSWEIIVLNWIDIMNIIFKKRIIRRSYPNIHLHIKYVRSFQEIWIYFDRPILTKWSAMTDDRPLFATLFITSFKYCCNLYNV